MIGVVKVWLATAAIQIIGLPRAIWRLVTRRHITEIRALLDAEIDLMIERRPDLYDWQAEPLDERDVALWSRQILTADEDQIMKEATR